MILGCCKICESVICGPGYCFLLPADAATVLLPLTLKHKHTKLNAKKKYSQIYRSIQPVFCSVTMSSFISGVSRGFHRNCLKEPQLVIKIRRSSSEAKYEDRNNWTLVDQTTFIVLPDQQILKFSYANKACKGRHWVFCKAGA